MNTGFGYADNQPFDINHRSISIFSLEKGVGDNDISKIIDWYFDKLNGNRFIFYINSLNLKGVC